MGPTKMPQLSLIAQYDDLCRHNKALTEASEKELKAFKQFIESQKHLSRKRKLDQVELEELRAKILKLEHEKKTYETTINYLRENVKKEVSRRRILEQEKATMELQITLIKDVLLSNGGTIDNETREKFLHLSTAYKQKTCSPNRLATIEESGSILDPSDCDDSDDMNIGITHRKRRSRENKSLDDPSLKKRRSDHRKRSSRHDDFILDDVVMDTEPKRISMDYLEPHYNAPEHLTPTPRPIIRSESEHIKELKRFDSVGYGNTPTPKGRFTFAGLTRKVHDLQLKTLIKTETCYVCHKSIKFCRQFLKCSNCRVTCHPECKEKLPEFCIYASFTPTNRTGTIGDYTSSTPPMIPPLIVHCVRQIESKGLDVIGLYRESGSKPQINKLHDTFLKGKSLPSLAEYDVHVLCGTIKSFLMSLKDTLITRAAWRTFVEAATNENTDESLNDMFNAVCNLPQPNRDTLAFLILHFQRIADSPECKMTIQNLARVFGPTIVGDSSEDIEPLAQTRLQYQVMEKLLMIKSESWQSFISVEDNGPFSTPFSTPMKTPECTPAPVTSRLGPILHSGQKSRNTTPVTRTPLKPRVTRSGSKPQKRQFFSPLLK